MTPGMFRTWRYRFAFLFTWLVILCVLAGAYCGG